MTSDPTGKTLPASVRSSNAAEVGAFLDKARSVGQPNGRLIFALDATMSRQPTWDRACNLQGEMFSAVRDTGGLAVQLLYFRGFNECRASKWVGNPDALRDMMSRIGCRGGQTQIAKVLAHARREAAKHRVGALVFIGDAMEEDIDRLCRSAGELGVLGLPCFMFQEGRDAAAERGFREIARLSNGAYMRFDAGSADALRNLLRAVASFASRGHAALESETSREGRLLLGQLTNRGGARNR